MCNHDTKESDKTPPYKVLAADLNSDVQWLISSHNCIIFGGWPRTHDSHAHTRVETDETVRGSQERVWAHVFAVDVHGAVLGGVARRGRQHLLDGGHLLPRERCRELHVEVHVQIALLVRAPMHRHSLVHDALPAVGFYHLARRLGHLETISAVTQ